MRRVLRLSVVLSLWVTVPSWAQPRGESAPDAASPSTPADVNGGRLELEHVLLSVQQHHPVVMAERAALAAAQGEAQAARGEFDTTLSVVARGAPAGYYDPRRVDVIVEQPTRYLGAAVYGAYRLTRGNVAPYYGEQYTLDRGEVRGGVRLPLLQDLLVDGRRAGLETTKAQLEAQQRTLEELLLDMERDAAGAYFNWVAAGQRLQELEALVELARFRDDQIRSKVALGALPSIEQLDNTRSLLERRRQLIAARRSFEKASLDLSLFLRDESGAARVPSAEDVPAELPELRRAPPAPAEAERNARERRPEIAAFEALTQAARVERELAENRVLPRLDAFAEVSKDFGRADPALQPTLEPTVVEVGVNFSVPLWLRRARGKLAAAKAKLESAQQKARFVQDKVQAEVRDALSQLQAAKERVEIAGRAAELAERIAVGERERFELGSSTVLFVNLREQTAADARITVIDALAELQFSAARLLTVSGEPLTPSR